jgi:hypothetical protein
MVVLEASKPAVAASYQSCGAEDLIQLRQWEGGISFLTVTMMSPSLSKYE